jgi:hypothetical protein
MKTAIPHNTSTPLDRQLLDEERERVRRHDAACAGAAAAPCEYCGAELGPDARTIAKKCPTCGMLSRTPVHPSHHGGAVQPVRVSPAASPARGAIPQPPAATTRPSIPTPAPAVAFTPRKEIPMYAAAHHDPLAATRQVLGRRLSPTHVRQLMAAYRDPGAPSEADIAKTNALVAQVGGDPATLRAGYLKSGVKPAQIERELQALLDHSNR